MFKHTLRDLRREYRLTQSDLAKILGTSTSTVGNWETGLREPDFETLQRLADYFHVTTDYLLGRDAAVHAVAAAPGENGQKEKAPAGDPAEAAPAPSREQMIEDIIRIYRQMSDAEKLDFLARLNAPKAP